MNPTPKANPLSAPRGFRRIAPAFALFFLSPFVAEMLLGDFSIDAIWLMFVVAPLYGGGALLVRETARRLGLGWPTMICLALAYGLLEEGIVLQTLFNPNYLGLHLLSHGYMPTLGMSAWWTPFVLTLHTVWSISVPIAIVEALFSERRTQPWLGNWGLGTASALLVSGAFLMHSGTREHDLFAASNLQLGMTWIAIALIAGLAMKWRARPGTASGSAPGAWIVGVAAMLLGLTFMKVPYVMENWPRAGAQWAVDLVGFGLLYVFARRAAWTPLHTLAVAGGAMMAYAIHAFGQDPVVGSKGIVDLVGNGLFAAMALVLLVIAARKARSVSCA